MKAELIDHMGDDLSVVNAARVSFDKRSEWALAPCEPEGVCKSCDESSGMPIGCWCPTEVLKPEDAKLISYLAKHNHWTPFAHTAISLRMEAPVPIRTQAFKHKQGLVENEESRRYIRSTPILFVPDEFRSAPTNGAKQGSGGVHPLSHVWKAEYKQICEAAIDQYEYMIREGVCPEQARFILPQGCEVHWVWTGNLYAFANFYNKRTDPHAQKEIRDLAEMVGKIVEPLFPVSWRALVSDA